MSNYKPVLNNTIPLVLLVPMYTTVSGVRRKTYPTVIEALKNKGNLFFGNFKTYGGTEREVNGVYSIEDTANIETWYRPDITSECRIGVANTEAVYDIINEPENVNMRNQFLKFKIRRVKGGA
nr:MAG TPA: PORTAL PROTEIN, 15 PROTEIN, HEAD PROTEIN, VIRAL INFECTION, TAILED.2A [Caudoviricetes sp.]